MKTLQRFKLGLFVVGTLMLTIPPTQALADQAGPYFATPSWDQTLPVSTRFIVLSNMNSEAVLDRETGLVWEKSPNTMINRSWPDAQYECFSKNVGGRGGWKLPSLQELRSLIDPTATFPALPAGHPFTNVTTSGHYWSANTTASNSANAWFMEIGHGYVSYFAKSDVFSALIWCVRGGPGGDLQ